MTRRRWIADEFDDHRAAISGENAAHLARVLRARAGQEFDIAAGDTVRRGRVLSVSRERVEFELGDEVPVNPLPDLVLLVSIFKFDRMDWVVEKATELGCSKIVMLVAGRSAVHLAQAAEKRVERWRRLAHAAAQQARRVAPPEISGPVALHEALGGPCGAGIVLAEFPGVAPLKEVLREGGAAAGVALAVGPEGGWTAGEMKLFGDAGWRPASLGENILRAETAAIAALAIVVSEIL